MTIEKMQELKKEWGYSYEQLAELSGLPVGTVQKVLGGITKTPRYETMEALERVFLAEQRIREAQAVQREYFQPEGPGSGMARSGLFPYQFSWEGRTYGARENAIAYGSRKQGEYTLEDYYRIPDERRVELIDGVIYDMAAPTSIHQVIGGEIYQTLAAYIKQNHGKCIPAYAPLDVQLDCDDRTMVQPDVLVVCDREKFKRGVVYGAPDFVVEILSKSTRKKDMSLKLNKYTYAGVREYWLVYPDQKRVVVYDIEHEKCPAVYGFESEIPVSIFEGKCKVNFAEIYAYVKFLYEDQEE